MVVHTVEWDMHSSVRKCMLEMTQFFLCLQRRILSHSRTFSSNDYEVTLVCWSYIYNIYSTVNSQQNQILFFNLCKIHVYSSLYIQYKYETWVMYLGKRMKTEISSSFKFQTQVEILLIFLALMGRFVVSAAYLYILLLKQGIINKFLYTLSVKSCVKSKQYK